MATIRQLEDIEAWKMARQLVKTVYELTTKREFSRDLRLCDQIRAAATSVVSNIGEGFERSGDKEFRQFLSVAKGSAGEVRAQLYVALDAGFLTEAEFQDALDLASSTERLLGGFIRYLRNSQLGGAKYK